MLECNVQSEYMIGHILVIVIEHTQVIKNCMIPLLQD